MKDLFSEIHERSLWQVLAIYLTGSWVVLQVVDTLNSVLGIPEWVVKASVALLAVGLPLVLVTAFVQRGWKRRTGVAAAASPEHRPGPFTWKNVLWGGVAAFALLGIGTTVWVGMRAAGVGPAGTLLARGVLGERDLILLADFENQSDDPLLAEVVTEALRVDLSQSDRIRLVTPAFVSGALRRMERPADSPLTDELASEVALREGIKAVVTGDVARAGTGYILSASLVATNDQSILISHRETARDESRLLNAIDRLGKHLRERIGDPLRSVAATPPLAQVTTANLAALRAYTEAVRLPETEAHRKIALLDRAVALDSTFAMAWKGLGIRLSNYNTEVGRTVEATSRAFELRDRLTAEERDDVSSQYYLSVMKEPRQAISHLTALVEARPSSPGPLNNLGEAYRTLGDIEAAMELYHRAIDLDATIAVAYMNLVQVNVVTGDSSAALAALAGLEVAAPPFAPWHRSMLRGGQRRYEEAEMDLRASVDAFSGNPFLLERTTNWLAEIVAVQGRFNESVELWERSASMNEASGSDVEALRTLVVAAQTTGRMRGSGGADALVEALVRFPIEDMDPLSRPYLELALAYAILGDPRTAREYLDTFEAIAPQDYQHGLRDLRSTVRGQIAMSEGRYADAVSEFRVSAIRPQDIHPHALLGQAFDLAGQPDSARVHYRRFLSSPHWLAPFFHSLFLVDVLERLGDLEAEAGNYDDAIAHYAELVELWANADPEVQPRVEAVRARMERLIRERG